LGGRFPTAEVKCACGRTLFFMASWRQKTVEETRAQGREYYHALVARRRAMGLNRRGLPLRVLLTVEERLSRRNFRWKRLADKYRAAGLTATGKPRVRGIYRRGPQARELQWRAFRVAMDIPG